MACWKLRIETKFHFQNSSLLSIYSTGALKWQKSAWDWMKLLCAPEWKCTRGYACQHGISNKCDCWKTGHIHALGWQADQTLVDNLCLDCGSLMRLVTTHHPPATGNKLIRLIDNLTISSHHVAAARLAQPIVEGEFRTANPAPCIARHEDTSPGLLTLDPCIGLCIHSS